MKTSITSTFLFLLILSSFGQQISVKSFRLLESDQEARIISPKKDQNGKKAAIIKVVTSQTGFVFDFGMIGNALATEQKTGEISVWVPAGARKVTINHQQLGVLRNYEFEIDILEATVYEMILTTGKVTTIVEEEQISTEWVVITSEPTGADVYIDDKATGMQTPYRKQLPMGVHTYRVSLDMYYPDVAKFELKPDGGKMKINSILKPAFGQLKLTTTPESGASVTLDGKPLSQITPCTIEKIKSGTHALIVSKALYHDATQNIEIKDEQTTTLAIDLKPAFGKITVSSTPESGAAVTLDDVATGKVTPCTLDKVQSGNHTVALRREWYAPIKKQLTVNDGEKATLEVPMNPLFGEVKITTTPEADIYIDNVKIATGTYNGRLNEGVYTIEARKPKHSTDLQKIQIETGATKTLTLAARPQLGILEIDSSPLDAVITVDGVNKGTTPATLRNLLVGDYNISLSLPNYATVSKTITIAEGQTTKLNEILQNGRPVTISSTPIGAVLYIDGNKIGTTPYSGSLAFGNHALRIENDGKKAEKTVTITQTGGETSFTLSFGIQTFTEIVNGVRFDMIAVKGGTFSMGNDKGQENEKPSHSVSVSDYYLGKTEVTVEQFKTFVEETAYQTTAEKNGTSYLWINDKWESKTGINWRCDVPGDVRNSSDFNHPVIHVSWNDAVAYCNWLSKKTNKNYRLPTEAEWEYALPKNTLLNNSKTSIYNNENAYAWYLSANTHPVATKTPNILGIYDMIGNVWEWCNDYFGNYTNEAQINPQGPLTGNSRVFRGGGWMNGAGSRCAEVRYVSSQFYSYSHIGFRVGLSANAIIEDNKKIVQTSENINTNIQNSDLNRGLIAYYPFNGNANDESGNGNNGIIHNVTLTTDKNENQNSAFYFKGIENSWIEVTHKSSLNIGTSFTVSAWIYKEKNENNYILGKGRDITCGTWALGTPSISVNGSCGTSAGNATALNLNQWYMVTGVLDGNTGKLRYYQDGKLITEVNSNSFTGDNNFPFAIGRHICYLPVDGSYSYPFKGKIDEIRVYSRTLNASEINQLYKSEKP